MSGRAFVSRFSPNRTNPDILEAIFVQPRRHALAGEWLGKLRDSILTGTKHHLLAVGPRGCGKSHLVSLLVSRLGKDRDVSEKVRIAWLPEDETTQSFWKFLLRILRALNAKYGDEFPPPPRDELTTAVTDDRRTAFLTDYLLARLAGRTLLVVVENLDDVMRGLKDEGQKRWRAFLQEHKVAATLATSQQLTEDMSGRDRAFFNFFQLEHLKPLTTDEALLLLQKIAEQTANTDLAEFLRTSAGRPRVRAIRHLAGGSHRVFIILSEFATREKLDDLVIAFEELLDELTPYYQERLRWLPDQQREIVEFLCRQSRTVQVKEIAGEVYLSEQTAAAQLKALKDKKYVTSSISGRESRYELAEPLMRLCVEVKDTRREPIRLIVEFLRVWYERKVVEAMLDCLPTEAEMEKRYLRATLHADDLGLPNPIRVALEKDLSAARESGDVEQLVNILTDRAGSTDDPVQCLEAGRELSRLGRDAEALAAHERAIELKPDYAHAWNTKGFALTGLKRYSEALAAYCRALELQPDFASAWYNKGNMLVALGQPSEALAAFDQALLLGENDDRVWNNKGLILNNLGRHMEALAAHERAIAIRPGSASAWNNKGNALSNLGRHADALAAYERAIVLQPKNISAWGNKGNAFSDLGRHEEALAALDRALELQPDYAIAWNNKGLILEELKRHAEALDAFIHAVGIRPIDDNWRNYLANMLAALLASSNYAVWTEQVSRLVELAKEPERGIDLVNALVHSLALKAYRAAKPQMLGAWADIWQNASKREPKLSLAVRVLSVGVRYLQTNDERVLLDLLQEERQILAELFGLSSAGDDA